MQLVEGRGVDELREEEEEQRECVSYRGGICIPVTGGGF